MPLLCAVGSNGSGQLGIGHKLDVSTPKQVIIDFSEDVEVQAISAGGSHTLILTSDGKLYSSGDASAGARGLTPADGFTDGAFIPVIFSSSGETPLHVTLCAATWEASIIVAKDAHGRSNRLFTFGTGNKGELGQGELLFRSSKAEPVKNFPPAGTEIVVLAAGMNHVVVVLDNGDVYGWGNGRKGQLGEPSTVVYEPRRIAHHLTHPGAVCGKDFTFLTVEATGDYQLLGSDKHDITAGIPAKFSGWDAVGAGWGSVTVLLEDGTLKSGGRDDHGQLAPANLPKILQVAVGTEHTVAITEEGDVVAWGWGEHGNCGPTTVNDVRKPNGLVSKDVMEESVEKGVLPKGIRASFIACGAATSFILLTWPE